MWYIATPAARASRSTTSAIVVRGEDVAGGGGGVAEDALGVAAERALEQLDDLEDGDLAGRRGRTCSRP